MTRRRTLAAAQSDAPRKRRRVVESVLVAIGCVLLADAVVGERGIVAMVRARREYRLERRALEHARAENVRLHEDIRRLREDPTAIEDLARRELGLIKPGEKLFTVKDVAPHED